MKKREENKTAAKEDNTDKKYTLLNAAIVVLTVVLAFMLLGLFIRTSPRQNTFFEEHTSEDLLRVMDYSGYQRLVEYKLENDALGVTVEDNPTLAIPNAIADYYEAAFCYTGYMAAGSTDKTAEYKAIMDEAAGRMGDYSYIAGEINEYLGLD